MEWYLKVLRQYADFTGRARRQEYWMFTLVSVIISIVIQVIEAILDIPQLLSGLYGLGVFIPSLAVGARRLHDTDRSGWWLLIALVPLIGIIVLIIFFVQDSTPGTNRYGPNPKEEPGINPAGA